MPKKYRSALSIGPEQKIQKVLGQTGKRKDLLKDAARSARLPGKRLSKNGNIYWETRKNRSDIEYYGPKKKGKVKPNI